MNYDPKNKPTWRPANDSVCGMSFPQSLAIKLARARQRKQKQDQSSTEEQEE